MRTWTLVRAEAFSPKRLLDAGTHRLTALQLDARKEPGSVLYVWSRGIADRIGEETSVGYSRILSTSDALTGLAGQIVPVQPGSEVWIAIRNLNEGIQDNETTATDGVALVGYEQDDIDLGILPHDRSRYLMGMSLGQYRFTGTAPGGVTKLLTSDDLANHRGLPISLRINLQKGKATSHSTQPLWLELAHTGIKTRRYWPFPGIAECEIVTPVGPRGDNTANGKWQLRASNVSGADQDYVVTVDVLVGVLPTRASYKLNRHMTGIAGTGIYETFAMALPTTTGTAMPRLTTYNHTVGSSHTIYINELAPPPHTDGVGYVAASESNWPYSSDVCGPLVRRSFALASARFINCSLQFPTNPTTADFSISLDSGDGY